MTVGKILLLPLGIFALYMIADTTKFRGNGREQVHSSLRGGAVKRGLAIGPPWTRGEMEAPRGEKDMGGWTAAVFDDEQQARLGIDEMGIPLDGSENAVTETNARNEEIAANMQAMQDDWDWDQQQQQGSDDDWEIISVDDGSMACPSGCTEWFDGCNTCSCEDVGVIGACTEMWCSMPESPMCYSWDDMMMFDTTTSRQPSWQSMTTTTTAFPRMCCRALTADCMSCSLGLTVEEYCGSNPDTVGCAAPPVQIEDPMPVLGGNQDEYGCIMDAGYTWCESKQYCLRSWEEDCPAPGADDVQACPQGCTTWFDGCNTCSCNGVGQVGGCTRMFCMQPETPMCYGYDEESFGENNPSTSDTSDVESAAESASSLEGAKACCMAMTVDCMACSYDMSNADYCNLYPDTVGCEEYTQPSSGQQMQQQQQNGQEQQVCPPGCTSWFDGCNTCTCNGVGEVGGCTMMMCFAPETPMCYSYGED